MALLGVALSAGAEEEAPRVLFEGPPNARERFEKGKRLPVICRNESEVIAEAEAAGAEPREVYGPTDPRLLDASDLVDRLYDNIKGDVALTRRNRQDAWVKKLPTDIYQWKLNALPPTMAAALGGRTRFKSCAVVGSSGHLGNTRYGSVIDQFDVIGRANQAPLLNYKRFVGSRTTFRFVNEAMGRQYRDAARKAAGFAVGECRALQERNASRCAGADEECEGGDEAAAEAVAGFPRIVTGIAYPNANRTSRARATFTPVKKVRNVARVNHICKEGLKRIHLQGKAGPSYLRSIRWRFPLEPGVILAQVSEQKSVPRYFMETQHNIKLLRDDVKLIMIPNTHTHMVFHVMDNWASRMVCKGFLPRKGGTRPTTGFQLTMVMLKLCNRVVLYGMGPSATGNDNYHFFTGHGARTGGTKAHNFRAEYLFYRSLAAKGLITICNDASDPDCGLQDIKLGEELEAKAVAAEAQQKEASRLQRSTRIRATTSSRIATRRAPLPGATRGGMTLVADILRHRRDGRADGTEETRGAIGGQPHAGNWSTDTTRAKPMGEFLAEVDLDLRRASGMNFADEAPPGAAAGAQAEQDEPLSDDF